MIRMTQGTDGIFSFDYGGNNAQMEFNRGNRRSDRSATLCAAERRQYSKQQQDHGIDQRGSAERFQYRSRFAKSLRDAGARGQARGRLLGLVQQPLEPPCLGSADAEIRSGGHG